MEAFGLKTQFLNETKRLYEAGEVQEISKQVAKEILFQIKDQEIPRQKLLLLLYEKGCNFEVLVNSSVSFNEVDLLLFFCLKYDPELVLIPL